MEKRKFLLIDSEDSENIENLSGKPNKILKTNYEAMKTMDNYQNLLNDDGMDGMEVDELLESRENQDLWDDDEMTGIDLGHFVDSEEHKEKVLDISNWKRCIVDDIQFVNESSRDKVMIISGHEDLVDSHTQMICQLHNEWAESKIKVGDVISIVAVWDSKIKSYCVTRTDGLIVIRADFLVSSTTVLSGIYCMRKTVLADRFKGIDPASEIMTKGTNLHEWFQIVLRQNLRTMDEIRAAGEKLLTNQQMTYRLYASAMTSTKAKEDFEHFAAKIYEFVQKYIVGACVGAKTNGKNGAFSEIIDSIPDIEENIWIPRLGMKGKVDATVQIRRKNKLSKMPLELKTGRPSMSPEHTGQLILYQMMMSETEKTQINSGLLLYLRECVLNEIKGNHRERRDLILLRNEISYYLGNQLEKYSFISKSSNATADENFELETSNSLTELLRLSNIPELPEPIDRERACQGCPYNILCSVYLNQDTKTMSSLHKNHPMREIAPLITIHLSNEHLDYFFHWYSLNMLEKMEIRVDGPEVIWTKPAGEREKNGSAVANLKLNKNVVRLSDNEFIHEFIAENKDITNSELAAGTYFHVSTSDRYAIASGTATSIEKNKITLVLERNLSNQFAKESFILDKHESQMISMFGLTNLGCLLDDTPAAARLRSIVIDRISPTFAKGLPKDIVNKTKPILTSVSSVQRTAILKAVLANEYLLLKGLPGTGKTQTIAALIRFFVVMGKTVLVTSHTHSAVDNVLTRLKKTDPNIKFMRLGSVKRISNTSLHEHGEHFLTKDCKTVEELEATYEQFSVFGITCLGSGHALLTRKQFDVCIVDESTQVFQSIVLRPLFAAKKIILVGDPEQLPPIVRSPIAKRLGADESLFARLDSDVATVVLTHQYRMNRTITKLANDLTYNGQLVCANSDIANATLKSKVVTSTKWLQKVLTSHIDQAVIFLNTGNIFELNSQTFNRLESGGSGNCHIRNGSQKNRTYVNYCEIGLILAIIKELKDMGIQSNKIGVIAPYALQVAMLKKCIGEKFDAAIEVNTVDQYQGRDKEVIIYSCTQTKNLEEVSEQSNKPRKNTMEILEDQRRLTVAITRAKHKLIMIGDIKSLESYRPFKKLIDSMSRMSKINLIDQQQGFDWRKILSIFDQTN